MFSLLLLQLLLTFLSLSYFIIIHNSNSTAIIIILIVMIIIMISLDILTITFLSSCYCFQILNSYPPLVSLHCRHHHYSPLSHFLHSLHHHRLFKFLETFQKAENDDLISALPRMESLIRFLRSFYTRFLLHVSCHVMFFPFDTGLVMFDCAWA